MSLVTTLKSDVYHLLQMCHVYIEMRVKFWAFEDLIPIFFVTDWFLGSRKYRKFPRLSNIYIYIYKIVSVHNHNQFSKDIFSRDSQFTDLSALKAYINTLPQSPCKARPHPTTMVTSQYFTFPLFATTVSKIHYIKG